MMDIERLVSALIGVLVGAAIGAGILALAIPPILDRYWRRHLSPEALQRWFEREFGGEK